MRTTNLLKTGLLLATLTALFAMVGRLLGGTGGVLLALGFAVLTNAAAYWYSDRLALTMARARRLAPGEAPGLEALSADLAWRARLPRPALYLIDDPSPNAFATGRNPDHAAIAVTTGLLGLLDAAELRAVLAHEFAHIQHRDILLTTMAATLAGAITGLAQLFQWQALTGHGDDEEGHGGLLGGLALLLLAPLGATLLQLALSRSREFAADTQGAALCGEPLALASALHRLERGAATRPMAVNPATAPLYIVHPFAAGGMARWFSTHPPVAARVARLEALAGRASAPAFAG